MPLIVMRRASGMLAVASLVWALAGCAPDVVFRPGPGPADTAAEAPRFSVGDEFWYRTGGHSIVVEVFAGEEDGLLAFHRPNQREYRHYNRDLALVAIRRPFGPDSWIKPDDGRLSFPLRVGKAWSRDFRVLSAAGIAEVRRTRRCEVAGRGELEIPGGRFDAFRILCTLEEFGETRRAEEEVFYAPAVGRIVLSRTRDRGIDLRIFEYRRAE